MRFKQSLGKTIASILWTLRCRILSLALAIPLILAATPVLSAELCSEVFETSVVSVSDRVAKNQFMTARNIWDYRQDLHPDFVRSLERLRGDQHWVDLGAGKAKAQIAFLKTFKNDSERPFATAVAYKLDRWFAPPNFGGKLLVKEGAFENHQTTSWRKVDLATDLFGVISYTPDLQRSFQKIFDFLNVGGELYILTTPWKTHFNEGGRSMTMVEFLRSLDGIRVEGDYGTLKITKLQENIQVPVLELTSIKDDAPPARTFKVERASKL